MGLDASVMCACLSNGLSLPPEFKDHFIVNDEGYPEFTLPYDGNETIHDRFRNWFKNACPHEDMELASERIATWGGIAHLQSALCEHRDFTHLLRELPTANGGTVDPSIVPNLLAELELFRTLDKKLVEYTLVDSDSGDIVWKSVSEHGGMIDFSPNQQIGVDEQSFFVKDCRIVVFRSTSFTQAPLEGGGAIFRDLRTGQAIASRFGIEKSTQNLKVVTLSEFPRSLHTHKHPSSTGEHEYLIEPLIRLCLASLKTGNPIRWS